MCFRPATTTVGARICTSCYAVCDDVTAVDCPSCGAKLDPPPSVGAAAPASPATPPAAPDAPQAPKAPEGDLG